MYSDGTVLSWLLALCAILYTNVAVQLHLGFRGGPGGGGGFVGEPRNWFINSSTKYFGKDLFSLGPGSSVASPGCIGSFGSRPYFWSCTLRWIRRTVLWKPGLRRICQWHVSVSVTWKSHCSFRLVPARRCSPAICPELAAASTGNFEEWGWQRREVTSRMRAVLMI